MLDMDQIRDWARLAQSLILELHASNPDHSTFSQAGLLNGLETVEEFLVHGEYGCAIHHLLYMVHESDIPFPEQEVIALHKVAEEIGERNHYTRANQERLPENPRQFGYNIPK